MEKLEFTRNDNSKLFLEYFSRIFFLDEEKFKQGEQFEIMFKGQCMGVAEVVAVRNFQFKHLSDVLAFIDMGKPVQYLAAAIKQQEPQTQPDTELMHVVFRYIARNLELQGTLLMNWWTEVYQTNADLSINTAANG